MVGYAFAAQHPDRVNKFVLIDAPLPGVGPWDDIIRNHALWHFSFYGPDAERLVKGRERIYLDRFWNEFSADPKTFDEKSRKHYAALYARPGAMHAGFEQFKAFDQDAADNKAFVAAGKLTMPILAIGGEKSFGPTMAVVMRAAAHQRDGRHRAPFGSLGHGGKSGGDHQTHHRFSRSIIAIAAATSRKGKAAFRWRMLIVAANHFAFSILVAVNWPLTRSGANLILSPGLSASASPDRRRDRPWSCLRPYRIVQRAVLDGDLPGRLNRS